jgi:hypothetical protein
LQLELANGQIGEANLLDGHKLRIFGFELLAFLFEVVVAGVAEIVPPVYFLVNFC